jgi:Bor protein
MNWHDSGRSWSLGVGMALAFATCTAGCYKATFVKSPDAVKRNPTHEEWTHHYVFGLVGDEKYDVRQWCPNGTAAVRTGGNAGTTALSIVTLGIYTPRKVYVTCDLPKATASNAEVRP